MAMTLTYLLTLLYSGFVGLCFARVIVGITDLYDISDKSFVRCFIGGTVGLALCFPLFGL
jgi:hypothetical protein